MTSFRPLMQGTNGMVVASHPAAAMAGLDVLRKGGNAIDAGVAVGLALVIAVYRHFKTVDLESMDTLREE